MKGSLGFASVFVLAGCVDPGAGLGGPAASPPPSGAAAPAASQAAASRPPAAAQARTVRAVYQNCTVYAAATDYYFRTADGQQVEFRNTNVAWEPKAVQVNVKLVDDSGQAEGPPGPNPYWVGKEFVLTYDSAGKIVAANPAS
jgi:hypothetical protein